jgi:hypothetical protein
MAGITIRNRVTAVTEAELRYGVALMAHGKRSRLLLGAAARSLEAA